MLTLTPPPEAKPKRRATRPARPVPGLEITYRPLAELAPYAKNSRTHSEAQIGKLVASIRQFGWTNPVLVDADGVIIAGHARVLAAKVAGVNPVPTITLGHLTAAQKRALVIADNQLAVSGAGWDMDILAAELTTLMGEGFDLAVTGFEAEELTAIFARGTAGETDPDEAPEVQAEAVSVLGDVWLLGKHRLLCGDCTEAAAVEAVLAGAKPHLMVTDPPYGIDYDANWRSDQSVAATLRHPKKGAVGAVTNDHQVDWGAALALFAGDVAYIWHAGARSAEASAFVTKAGFDVRAQIIWAKNHFAVGRGHYHPQHEPCWYAVRKGGTGHWHGDRSQSTVWQIDKQVRSETGHSTQKPLECMKRPIENNSRPGDAVYEPFSGSGTTIIAAEMTGRVCHAIEIEPRYVDVAVRRWEAFTGGTATLEATGQSFAQVTDARS